MATKYSPRRSSFESITRNYSRSPAKQLPRSNTFIAKAITGRRDLNAGCYSMIYTCDCPAVLKVKISQFGNTRRIGFGYS